jgi:hypothetical protein
MYRSPDVKAKLAAGLKVPDLDQSVNAYIVAARGRQNATIAMKMLSGV